MPKPTDTFTFATDTNHNDPGEAWDGTVTKTAPSAGRQASGWRPTERPAANVWNWIWNAVGQWVAFLDSVFQSDGEVNYIDGAKLGTLRIGPQGGSSSGTAASPSAPYWSANGPIGEGTLFGYGDKQYYFKDITPYLSDRCSFAQVQARVTPGRASDGASYRLTGDRMELAVLRIDNSATPPTSTQLGSTAEDDGTGNAQSLICSFTSETVDKLTDGYSYVVRIRSSNDADTVTYADELHYFRVSISVPGPAAL